MGNIGLSRLQHLLLALLLLAMTGCGASNSNIASTPGGSGKISAKLSYATSKTAKTVASAASVDHVDATVTGTALGGGAIPVVRGTLTATGGSVTGIYPGTVTLGLIAKDSAGNVLYEGYALYVTVNPGSTTTLADPIVMSPPLTKAQDAPCASCHETTLDINGQNLVAGFKQSGHYTNQSWTANAKYGITGTGCAGCHGPSHNDPSPALSGRCYECHGSFLSAQHTTGNFDATTIQKACGTCHQPHNTTAPTCVGCHSIPQNAGGSYVQDNNGVRTITTEFGKWSHHVTGVDLNDAHCAACHLEGKVNAGGSKIVADFTKHVFDNKVHLRNADTDADLAWDPASPNLSTMDTFCLSCHDSDGATSTGSQAIQAFINASRIAAAGKTASAKNPFGDTISNRYDKLQRPGVVDAKSQFNPANNSHHAVLGKRYTGRSRVAADARHIASPSTFANNSSTALQGKRSTIYDAGNFNQLYTPLANADGSETNTVASLTGRTGSLPLGDDSTLHCGDCHTVGQWKKGSSETANGSPTPVAIGAHGSNNEYLLRNSIGTDERHTQNAFLQGNATGTVTDPATGRVLANGEILYTNPNGAFLVCYNCHSYNRYGSLFLGTGLNGGTSVPTNNGLQPHAGEYDAQGRCNGVGNTIPFNGYTTGTATDGSQFASRFMGPITKYSSPAPYQGEQNPDFGNIFGIQCLNCHNSGVGNAYGGIHGSANDTSWNNGTTTITPASLGAGAGGYYIDGMGNATKVERFLPGLGNVMHVPGTLGGVTGGSVVPINTAVGPNYTYTTGGITNDTNWEQKQWQQTATTIINGTTGAVSNTASAGAGCYTLGATQQTGANIVKSDVASGLVGPSVTGQGGAATEVADTWGGCDDHTAGQAKGNHGFLKRIIRPVTY